MSQPAAFFLMMDFTADIWRGGVDSGWSAILSRLKGQPTKSF